MRKRKRHRSKIGLLWFTIITSIILSVFMFQPSYFFINYLAVHTDGSVPFFIRVLIPALWSFFCYFLFYIFRFGSRKHIDKKNQTRPINTFDKAMDALDRIARGDYDINIEQQEHNRFDELAEKINRLAKDLSSVEQMRQEFVSNVSHEIQSPLTSISGFAVLLKKEDLDPQKRIHYIDVIEAESKRLSKLSENLLRLSVLDAEQSPLSLQPYRLDKQIKEVLVMLEPQWSDKDIDLDISLDKLTFLGDEELFSQVWINLLHNSIKFTPLKGRITVELTQENSQLICNIKDTGAGMPEESLLRIFERFYKVDKSRDRSLGGNGLGLALVKKIIDVHNGIITVESKIGTGTVFTISLPYKTEYNE